MTKSEDHKDMYKWLQAFMLDYLPKLLGGNPTLVAAAPVKQCSVKVIVINCDNNDNKDH